MSSSSKKRQTMAKMTRERTLQERRELKRQRKDERKQAAAAERDAEATGTMASTEAEDDELVVDDETLAAEQ
jgi:hypothetical protein